MVLSRSNSRWNAVLLGCLASSTLSICAQPAPSAAQPLRFDLVSVRPLSAGESAQGFLLTRSGFQAQGIALDTMLAFANNVDFNHGQVVGGPDWLKTQRFVIRARIAPADSAAFLTLVNDHTPEGQARQRALIGRLLVDEFKLKAHIENRLADIYSLGVADGGPKLKPGMADDPSQISGRPGSLVAKNLPFASLVGLLGNESDRAVSDATGLKGAYDFTLDWLATGAAASAAAGGASKAQPFATAVQQQLGLTLTPKKAPLPYVVIDSAERPTMDTLEAQLAAFPLQAGDFGTYGFYNTPPKIDFSIVSFKRCDVSKPGSSRVDMPLDSDYVAYHCQPLSRLIYFAYTNALETYTVPVGYPPWVESDLYEFIAKVAEPDIKAWQNLTLDQKRVVMRTILADSAKMQMRLEMTPQPAYLLEADKHGGKLTPAKPGDVTHLPDGRIQEGRNVGVVARVAYFHDMAMWDLAANLTGHLDRPVIDNSGLVGTYTFALPAPVGQLASPHQRWPGDEDGPTIAEGLAELGLKLTPAKVPMVRLVLAHIDRPPED